MIYMNKKNVLKSPNIYYLFRCFFNINLDFILQLKVHITQLQNKSTLRSNQRIKDLIVKSKI